MADEKEVDLNEESNPESIFTSHCSSCEGCGRGLDHPPIALPTGRAFFERTNRELPPVLSIPTISLCRFCVLEALAPLETPPKDKPNVGWCWRKIINGDLEPSGTPPSRKGRVGEEVPKS